MGWITQVFFIQFMFFIDDFKRPEENQGLKFLVLLGLDHISGKQRSKSF